jgi:hypothetical protein
MNNQKPPVRGNLSAEACQVFALEVCESAAGYYLGTRNEDGEPLSRQSVEYWHKRETAEAALLNGSWTQRPNP